MEAAPSKPKIPTLEEILVGAEQAGARVAQLPTWMRELTPGSMPTSGEQPKSEPK